MRIERIVVLSAVALLWAGETAPAQNLTVQQPAMREFGVNTSVSVPDRGGTFLGGVSRSAASRSRFGPFRSGTATGFSRSHVGTSAHVFIHDLEAMDRAVLRRGHAHRRPHNRPPLNGSAEHAYQSLLTRQEYHSGAGIQTGRSEKTQRGRIPRVSRRPIGQADSAGKPPVPAGRAEKFYRLGLHAEERGSSGVARLHYRMAVKYGSEAAKKKLAALDE